MASPEAETFLWRRILLDERVYSTNRAPGGCSKPGFITFRFTAHERFYATIFVKRLFYTDATAGQRLHTDQNLPSAALSDSDC
jgi:hypothetical protein